jgi:hypothetical protein
MTAPPIQPSEWWALVNAEGSILEVGRNRGSVIDAFTLQFRPEHQHAWEVFSALYGLSIRRVIVQAPEVG